jgi:phosphoribosylformylglycinamidine (FGAM) synthase-like enzyme
MAIAGRFGVAIDELPHPDATTALFSESNGRFVCELMPDDVAWFMDCLDEPVHVIGEVVRRGQFEMPGWSVPLEALRISFSRTPG